MTRRQTVPRTNPVALNHATLPTQNGPSTSDTNVTSQPGMRYQSQHVETRFSPAVVSPPSNNGAQATVVETRALFELRPNGKEMKWIATNGAPPTYNESIQLPLFDIASLPAYDDSSDLLPAYEDEETCINS